MSCISWVLVFVIYLATCAASVAAEFEVFLNVHFYTAVSSSFIDVSFASIMEISSFATAMAAWSQEYVLSLVSGQASRVLQQLSFPFLLIIYQIVFSLRHIPS